MEARKYSEEAQIKQFLEFDPHVRQRLIRIAQAERLSYKRKATVYPCGVKATASQIIETVCYMCNVSLDMLASKKRDEYIARPRHIVFYLLKSNGMTFKEAGKLFNRDHSTVIYACNEHPDKMKHDEFYAKKYNNIVSHLNHLNK